MSSFERKGFQVQYKMQFFRIQLCRCVYTNLTGIERLNAASMRESSLRKGNQSHSNEIGVSLSDLK